jgi:hypothetical protein
LENRERFFYIKEQEIENENRKASEQWLVQAGV